MAHRVVRESLIFGDRSQAKLATEATLSGPTKATETN